jgi:hypothetical protein
MNWEEIKSKVIEELNNPDRNLSNPDIRANALKSIEGLLKEVIIANPDLLQKIEKSSLLDSMEKLKKLNSAEKSVVNHIYAVLEGKEIPIKKRKEKV